MAYMTTNTIKNKSDVDIRGDWGRRTPALNVKVYLWESGDTGSWSDKMLSDIGGPDFLAWWRSMDEDRLDRILSGAVEWAAEDGFYQAREAAQEIFGPVKVWQEGRSGGWLVVDGLEDVDGWDAIALGRWRKFACIVDALVADHAYRVVELVYLNQYENEMTERENLASVVDKWASLAGVVAC